MTLQSSPLARHLAGVALTCAMALPTLAHAQMASGPTLYEQLGGKPAITKVVHDMIMNVAADSRINHFFAKTNIPHLQMELVNQVCEGTGGPCKYTGLNGAIVGMTTFGESAPAEQLFDMFGFTVANVVAKAKAIL